MLKGFLQCDAQGCGHREENDELREDQIGKPCPKCGASLLTREDYDVYVSRIKPMFDMMKALGLLVDPESGEGQPISVHYHDGATTIRELGRS
ncbi:hypothetical protein [Sphingobium mellinum]|uniref:hypothetical protein n=1 Tax=Sphingobium mellinum TaxID=1387166 RepID=UPI0030EB2F8F